MAAHGDIMDLIGPLTVIMEKILRESRLNFMRLLPFGEILHLGEREGEREILGIVEACDFIWGYGDRILGIEGEEDYKNGLYLEIMWTPQCLRIPIKGCHLDDDVALPVSIYFEMETSQIPAVTHSGLINIIYIK